MSIFILRVVLLIFRSGKIVVTGAKSENQIKEAVEKIIAILIENKLLY